MSAAKSRTILWILSSLGLVIGWWALVLPAHWYETFPDGLAHTALAPWIMVDGPYNEHLIRDVGSMYLGLAAAGVIAASSKSQAAARAVAAGWFVFSCPHLIYHAAHLHELTLLDALIECASLALTLLLPIPLLVPKPKAPPVPGARPAS